MSQQVILHITSESEWNAAQQEGAYKAPSLDSQGFIHLSKANQVQGTLNRFYPSATNLTLLHIDPEKLQATLKYEAPDHTGAQVPVPATSSEETFPHLYGVLNLDAVTRVETLNRDSSENPWVWSLAQSLGPTVLHEDATTRSN